MKEARPISRQRAWQMQQQEKGLCILCARPSWRRGAPLCAMHLEAERLRRKAKRMSRIAH